MNVRKKLTKKKKIILISSVTGVAAVAAGCICFFVFRHGSSPVQAMTMSTNQAAVTTGDINNTVVGTGTLADDTAQNVVIPTGITIDQVLVESGDTVQVGDTLATVTDASVKSAIVDIQESLTSIDDRLDELEDEDDDESITVEVDGEEQTIYTSDIEYDQLVAQQAELTTALEEMVKLSQTNAITATYSGTIESVNVTAGSEVEKTSSSGSTSGSSSGSTSGNTGSGGMTNASTAKTSASTASGTGSVGGFTYLSTTTDTNAVSTPTSDTANTTDTQINTSQSADVSTIVDETSAEVNTASLPEDTTEEAADTISDNTTIESTTGTELKGAIALNVTAPATGGTPTTADQLGIPADAGYTADIVWTPSIGTAGTFAAGTQYTATIRLSAKTAEGYYFTDNASKLDISISSIANAPFEIKNLGDTDNMDTIVLTLAYPSTAAAASGSNNNSASSNNSADTNTTQNNTAGSGDASSQTTAGTGASSGSSGAVSGSSGSASGTSGSTSGTTGNTSGSSNTSTTTDLYSSYEMAGFTISTGEDMILSVNVDELDILSIKEGQDVSVTLDAVDDETFSGTISSIATSSTSSGGVSKYAVKVTLPKTDSMLAGMNASATISISQSEGVLTIPVSALQEQGDKVFVYTGEDADGNLTDEVEVSTGLSDGSNVEITSGLSEGDTVYYVQADTSDTTEESTQKGMGGMMMGGAMSGASGERSNRSGGTNMPNGGGGMGAPGQ